MRGKATKIIIEFESGFFIEAQNPLTYAVTEQYGVLRHFKSDDTVELNIEATLAAGDYLCGWRPDGDGADDTDAN